MHLLLHLIIRTQMTIRILSAVTTPVQVCNGVHSDIRWLRRRGAYDSAQERFQLGQMPLHVLRANGLLHRATANGTGQERGEHQRQKPKELKHSARPRANAAGNQSSLEERPAALGVGAAGGELLLVAVHHLLLHVQRPLQVHGDRSSPTCEPTPRVERSRPLAGSLGFTWGAGRLSPFSLNPLAVTAAAINSPGRRKAEEAAWKLLPRVCGGSVSSRTRSPAGAKDRKAPPRLATPG